MPYLQVIPLVIEQSLPTKLHAENEEAEQLRQSSAEDIEPQIHLKPVSQVGERVLPERAMLMYSVDDAGDLIEPGMVNLVVRQQAV